MKNVFLLIFILFVSCKKDVPKKTTTFSNYNKSVLKPLQQTENLNSEKLNDTIQMCFDDDGLKNDFIKITLEKLVYDKDSISLGSLRIDFNHNSKYLKSFKSKIQNYNTDFVWTLKRGFFEKTKSENSKSKFFTLSSGFPACGYAQSHYLLCFDSLNFNLVHSWFSSFDGDFNSFQKFITDKNFDESKNFYGVMLSVEPDEKDDNIGTVNYSDSICYFKQNNVWKVKYITKKDLVFRKEKINFKEFYK